MSKPKRKRKPKTKSREEAKKLACAYLTWQSMMKNCIVQMEDTLGKLLALAKPGDSFEALGVTYTLVDNFASKNTTFKPTAFRRLDLKATKGKVG
jgi:hypothetical protein